MAAAKSWSFLITVLVVALGLSWPSRALAVDGATRTMLRELSREGVEAYRAGNYDVALEKLEKAYAILPTAPLGLWSARALEKKGRLVEASERYLAATRAAMDPGGEREPQEAAKADAQKEQSALEPRIPRLTVKVTGVDSRDLELLVNDEAFASAFLGQAMPVNPGTTVVTLRHGSDEVKRTVTLGEGERTSIEVDWPSAVGEPVATTPTQGEPTQKGSDPTSDRATAGPRRSWQPLAGWIGVGVGAAGLAMGGITGVMAADLHAGLGCDNTGCPPTATPEQRSEGNTLRTLSTVGFVAGGVLVATGLTLLFTAPKLSTAAKPGRSAAATITPVIGLGSLGVEGSF